MGVDRAGVKVRGGEGVLSGEGELVPEMQVVEEVLALAVGEGVAVVHRERVLVATLVEGKAVGEAVPGMPAVPLRGMDGEGCGEDEMEGVEQEVGSLEGDKLCVGVVESQALTEKVAAFVLGREEAEMLPLTLALLVEEAEAHMLACAVGDALRVGLVVKREEGEGLALPLPAPPELPEARDVGVGAVLALALLPPVAVAAPEALPPASEGEVDTEGLPEALA